MKYLIVGLGNVGNKYEGTRHNIGFMILDKMVADKEGSFEQQKLAYRTEIKHKGRTFILIKPTTFMNLSGKAVRYYLQQEKVPIENLLIVTDDIALPLGKTRMRGKGSDGGHNGLKNIQELINTTKYPRLRVGVGGDFAKGKQVDYVLGHFELSEQVTLSEVINKCCEAIYSFGTIGIERTMNFFN